MTNIVTKTRFAPSPTGEMHIGNARTALFNALAAKRDGCFLLRMEDTDSARSEERYLTQLVDDLANLGIDWQEGEERGGEHAPYRQSARTAIYTKYLNRLMAAGHAYKCFCSADTLAAMRHEQRLRGVPPRYDGRCRNLSAETIANNIAEGKPYVVRFRVPDTGEVRFTDAVKGAQRFACQDIGDFVLTKSDGSPAFFFANAIDDALMKVSLVLRGDDHLTNTPRQLLILQALGLDAPQYGHVSTILGEDGKPLSKRNGSASIRALLAEGWRPLAILNTLARLGHYYAEERLLDWTELTDHFSLSRLNTAAARFDMKTLAHWQRLALMTEDGPALWDWMADRVRGAVGDAVPSAQQGEFAKVIAANILLPKEAAMYAAITFGERAALSDAQQAILSACPDGFFARALAMFDEGADYASITNRLKAEFECSGKALHKPLRLALTGLEYGPNMGAWLPLMPADTVRARLQA